MIVDRVEGRRPLILSYRASISFLVSFCRDALEEGRSNVGGSREAVDGSVTVCCGFAKVTFINL